MEKLIVSHPVKKFPACYEMRGLLHFPLGKILGFPLSLSFHQCSIFPCHSPVFFNIRCSIISPSVCTWQVQWAVHASIISSSWHSHPTAVWRSVQIVKLFIVQFEACSQSREKRLWASSCSSVRMYWRGCHWTYFGEIWYWGHPLKSVESPKLVKIWKKILGTLPKDIATLCRHKSVPCACSCIGL
jgi:hypothetical protein